ncbi:hypothetical protein D3C81_1292060 [compost metagenome]
MPVVSLITSPSTPAPVVASVMITRPAPGSAVLVLVEERLPLLTRLPVTFARLSDRPNAESPLAVRLPVFSRLPLISVRGAPTPVCSSAAPTATGALTVMLVVARVRSPLTVTLARVTAALLAIPVTVALPLTVSGSLKVSLNRKIGEPLRVSVAPWAGSWAAAIATASSDCWSFRLCILGPRSCYMTAVLAVASISGMQQCCPTIYP